MPTPQVQRFNALVESFDVLTLYRYENVRDFPTLFGNAALLLGLESSLVKALHKAALTLGYGPINPQTK